jgi:hypothetical protein
MGQKEEEKAHKEKEVNAKAPLHYAGELFL